MALALAIGLAPDPAQAACIKTDSTVTCTGASAPFDAGAQNSLSVTVLSGATIVIPGPSFGGIGLTLNDFNDPVINNGTITGDNTASFATGIQIGSNNGLTTGVINNGTISLDGDGSNGIVATGDHNVIVNNNTISLNGVGGFGIRGGNNSAITNNNSITGNNSAGLLSAVDNNTITNNGTLIDSGNGTGIAVQDGNTVVNSASGTITTGDFGLGINASNTAGTTAAGTITNAGGISVGAGSGLGFQGVGIAAFQNYTINNSGTINVGSNADGIAITQNNTVNNTNTITADTGGNAIHVLGGTGNVVNNSASGSLTSNGVGILLDANSGLTLNNSGNVTATASGGIGISLQDNTSLVVTNSGAITGDANAILAADPLTTVVSSVTVNNLAGGTISSLAASSVAIVIGNGDTGTITNANGGTITGDANAILGNTASILNVTNSGAISQTGASGIAIAVNGTGTITNTASGTITASGAGSTGISTQSGISTVNNAGTITADQVGISIGGATTVNNSGSITGTNGSAITIVNFGAGTATIVNSGTLTGSGASPFATVWGDSGSTYNLTNTSSGTITAADAFGTAVQLDSNSSIVNNGLITVANGVGVYALQGGNTIINSSTGTILVTDAGTGINSIGDGNTIVNAGTISVGASGTGIVSNSNTTLPPDTNPNIINSGTITGLVGAIGIQVADNNQIKNIGTISVGDSGVGVQMLGNGSMLNNSGTIRAAGTGYSIEACSCSAINNTFSNNAGGTLDGKIFVLGTNNTVNNSGLIIITDPNTPIAPIAPASPFNFIIQGTSNTFTQSPSGTLALRMDNTGAIDRLIADQIPSLAGTLRVVIQNQLYANTLTSSTPGVEVTPLGTANQTFDRFTASSPFFTVTPIYDTSDPTSYSTISIQLDRIAFGSVPGATANERAVGNALEPGYSTTLTGNAAAFYSNLLAATSLTVLDQLSGEGVSAAQGAAFGASGAFNSAMFSQGLNGDNTGAVSVTVPATQYAATRVAAGHEAFASINPQAAVQPDRWRVWASGFGATRSISGEASTGSSSQSIRSGGGSFGVDRRFGSDLLFGFAVGASESNFSASALATSGRLVGGHVGVYAVKTWGASYGAASLNYARFENSTTRTIAGLGTTETATGSFASDQIGGRFEIGHKLTGPGYTVTPFVAIEPSLLWQHAFTETSVTAGGGPGIFGLSYASRTTPSLPTFLGAQFDTRTMLSGGAVLSPYARVSWVHEFLPNRQVSATFITIPTASFTVDGARPASDAARLDAGAKLLLSSGRMLFANVSGEWSNRSSSYTAMGGFKSAW